MLSPACRLSLSVFGSDTVETCDSVASFPGCVASDGRAEEETIVDVLLNGSSTDVNCEGEGCGSCSLFIVVGIEGGERGKGDEPWRGASGAGETSKEKERR